MWPRKDKGKEGQRPSSIGPLKHRKSVALHSALCARLGGRSTPLQKGKAKRKEDRTNYPSPPRSSTSSVSHAIHSSILTVCAPSSSVPSAVVLPTPDNSKKRTNRLSHLGLANNTRTPPGFFPSHASLSADRSLSLGQYRRTCERVILAGPRKNQHLSFARFLIRLR